MLCNSYIKIHKLSFCFHVHLEDMMRTFLKLERKHIHRLLVLGTILSLILACEPNNSSVIEENLEVKVTNSSGDDFFYEKDSTKQFFAPFPFNVGTLVKDSIEYEVMIISKKLRKGSRLDIIPVARLTLIEPYTTQKNIFVGVPKKEEERIFDGISFYDFSVEHFYYKQIIEYWYANRYGLQGTTIDGWSPVGPDYFNDL